MGKINKVFSFIAGLILFPSILFAQFNNSTSSPYSRYGLGDLHSTSFGRTSAMGGASLASRYKLQINSANPASYTAIDSLNFLFDFGIQGKFSAFKSSISSMNTNNVNFNYFAMSFRITNKIATALGLQPYSDIGYQVQSNKSLEETGDVQINYYGTGTISKAYFGVAFEPFENISLGVNFNYLFGQLNRNSEETFRAQGAYSTLRYSQTRISDFGLDFGLQATLPLKNNKELTFAATFANQSKVNGVSSDIILKETGYVSGNQTIPVRDTLAIREAVKGTIRFPYTFGGGVSLMKKDVYEINFDYYHQNWSEATFFGQQKDFLTNLNKFAIGAEWIPNRFSIKRASARMAYRAGIKYEQGYHSIGGHQINDFGISFGVGIPMYRSASTMNIGIELGRKGTKKYNLVLENYAKVNFSLNLHDLWFLQRKID